MCSFHTHRRSGNLSCHDSVICKGVKDCEAWDCKICAAQENLALVDDLKKDLCVNQCCKLNPQGRLVIPVSVVLENNLYCTDSSKSVSSIKIMKAGPGKGQLLGAVSRFVKLHNALGHISWKKIAKILQEPCPHW